VLCRAASWQKMREILLERPAGAEAKLPADGGPVQPGLADRYDPAACICRQAPLAGGWLRRLPPPGMGGGGAAWR
jgi:hypothetical protein